MNAITDIAVNVSVVTLASCAAIFSKPTLRIVVESLSRPHRRTLIIHRDSGEDTELRAEDSDGTDIVFCERPSSFG